MCDAMCYLYSGCDANHGIIEAKVSMFVSNCVSFAEMILRARGQLRGCHKISLEALVLAVQRGRGCREIV